MRALFISFLFLFSSMVYSQVGPINEIISCHPCGSDLMIEADMDLDGTPDLLFYSEIDQKMAWVKNDGQGNFVSRTRPVSYTHLTLPTKA